MQSQKFQGDFGKILIKFGNNEEIFGENLKIFIEIVKRLEKFIRCPGSFKTF